MREQGRANGKTELTTTGALLVARQCRPSSSPTLLLTPQFEQLEVRHRFAVSDAAALPWPLQRRPRICSVSAWSPRLPAPGIPRP